MRTREWKEGLFRSSSRKRRFGNFYFFYNDGFPPQIPGLIFEGQGLCKKKASVSRGVFASSPCSFVPRINIFLTISILELQFTTRKEGVSTTVNFSFSLLIKFLSRNSFVPKNEKNFSSSFLRGGGGRKLTAPKGKRVLKKTLKGAGEFESQ